MDQPTSYQDLVSWTLDNPEIGENRLIFVDAIHPDRRLVKSQIRRTIRQLIRGLRFENGGDYLDGAVVCLHAFNDILYPAISLAIIGAGGCWTGTNPAYTASELIHHFKTSNTRFIITEPEHLQRVQAAASACDIPNLRIFTFSPTHAHTSPVCRDWTDLLKHGESDWIRFNDARRSCETPVGLFSTSGTTGLPKMAKRTHLSFVAESIAIRERQSKPYKETRLLCVPFFHAFVAPLSLIAALRHGVTTYVMRRYEHTSFLAAVKEFDITETALVPPVIIKFLSCSAEEQQMLRNLRLIWCGGAPLDAVTQAKGASLLASDGRIAQVWGMTECGWISTFHHPERDFTGAVGRLIPGYRAKLLTNDDTEVTDRDTLGEICVKGPMLMQGYHGDSAATAASFTQDGWFRTGDIARLDGDLVYIVDRKKELIKVRGWQVAPAELEGTLLKHSAIIDAAVIGIPAVDGASEVPRAYVICKPGCSVSEQDIRSFLLMHLARYKVSDCQVRFCENIPRSPSGKILRKTLRAEAGKEGVELPTSKREDVESRSEGVESKGEEVDTKGDVEACHQSSLLLAETRGGVPFVATLWYRLYRRLVAKICGFVLCKGSFLNPHMAWLKARLQSEEQYEHE